MSMGRIRLTYRAEQDLLEIARNIADDSQLSAIKVLDEFDQAFVRIANQPLLAAIFAPRPNYRHFAVKSYVVFYQVDDDGVLVARILHGARNLLEALEQ
jgi:plasmid stabilization system protein ParE